MGASQGKDLGFKLPLVYNKAYNVRFMGIEKLHSFDSCKYEKIVLKLSEAFGFSLNNIHDPLRPATTAELLDVHTKEYLDSLKDTAVVARVCELPPLAWLPRSIVESRILVPNRYQVRGTMVAGALALHYGWAINIGGGMHHASSGQGGGWCIFSDIFLAFRSLRTTRPGLKMMIVDLDVHQGNGLGRDKLKLHGDDDVFILDAFNPNIYPGDEEALLAVNRTVHVTSRSTDDSYIADVGKALNGSIASFAPDIIFYNAGTDILAGDPLNGGVRISADGIRRRDELVFEAALSKKIPIVMVLSGGYARDNASVVADSIASLIRTHSLIDRAAAVASGPASS